MELKPGQCLLQKKLRSINKSQKWLSNKTKIPTGRISEYANNNRMMSLVTAKKIAMAIECEIDDLYEWIWE